MPIPKRRFALGARSAPGKIVLGVSGGIAAYKACELVRLLVKAGHSVRVIMTAAATEFVTPLTFASLSGHPALVDTFGPTGWKMEHLELAHWADLMIVAPATADVLSRFAAGAADDLLATTYVTFEREVLLAPAMHPTMFLHPAVVENRRKLEAIGARFVGPVEGELAAGTSGLGRMAEPAQIAKAAEEVLSSSSDLAGRQVLVTAGPTQEYLDPVRFLSNPSSGLMGLELAREAARRGARVCLVHGPLAAGLAAGDLPAQKVTSARDMYEAVMSRLSTADVFIGAAAVSDFSPARASRTKIKKDGKKNMTLELVATPDILAAAGAKRRPGQVIVGFALETGDLAENARKKLQQKGADLMVANEAGEDGFPFGAAGNRVLLVSAHREPEALPLMSKRLVARAVLDRVRSLLDG